MDAERSETPSGTYRLVISKNAKASTLPFVTVAAAEASAARLERLGYRTVVQGPGVWTSARGGR